MLNTISLNILNSDPTICKNKYEHTDAYKRCVQWKNQGYCYGEYEAWMSNNCGESCGLCTPKGKNILYEFQKF